ncbi:MULTISPECIES: hypothetical protein [unclassified Sphingobacterium]|uniref:hypothetical protein n=1 Tax=unclassified Sphingobacterium TaxID=2609468 RepID=UPI00104BCBDA|nr:MULTISPECIES: hypothetical protein [unclassified Sphingobacterium]MCS3555413.1 hypothetical protein [Sphingobacterium sp. JUb21]NJI76165.1 hypothetical protein [Sphingobacterium sp. B16(2022)]TCR02435.1 long-subunit fatty acid transport protein [Sphingobacterium sp. JUb20]
MQKRFLSSITSKVPQVLLTLGLLYSSSAAFAQKSTSASPYSQFGLGQMREDLLPQHRAMGGLSTGVRYFGSVYNTNPSNPASYSAAQFSTFDAGLYGNFTQLSSKNKSDNTADFAFSHITMTFPMKKAGGISIGLLPYSDLGYNSNSIQKIDTVNYRKTFTGEGGLTKAYFGYGVNITKNFSVGANISYLFGTLNDFSRLELPFNYGLNVQQQDKREIQGVSFDYGAQYYKTINKEYSITVGYSGSLNNAIHDRTTSFVTRTLPSNNSDDTNIALDTVSQTERTRRDLNLPLKHNVGITFARTNRWLVGAEFKYADWSKFQVRKNEENLKTNYGFAIGGQITPDPTSFKYTSLMDYRIGFRYNRTQYFINKQDINDMAITFGVGLPLARNPYSGAFSKINISAELGQMGTMNNSLIRERYVNLNVGFTLNDRWFRRNSID